MAKWLLRCRSTDCILLFVASFLIIPAANAKKFYKFQDAGGIWHFTDIKPADSRPFEVLVEPSSPPQRITIEQRGSKKEPTFYFVNAYHGPVQIEVEVTRLDNLLAEPAKPKRFLVPPASEVMAFGLRPLQPNQSGSYSFTYRSVIGDPNAKPDPDARYRPPYLPGESFTITQGFHGLFTHNDAQNEYAVDFDLPEGTPVCAARSGVVMEVVNDFFGHGLDKSKFAGRANWIRILHDDGTMAVYAHLKVESARVKPGQRVSAGQVIAESGNTGLSTGPHLHFVVQRNANMHLVSLPFLFKDDHGHDVAPENGETLVAY